MKNLKKLPTKQLEKFSNIFMQLGLVLVLFIVYVALEHQTEQKTVAVFKPIDSKKIYIEPDQIFDFVKEEKVKVKPRVQKTQVFIPEEIVKGDNNVPETIIDIAPTEDPVLIDIDNVVEVKIKEKMIEDVPYAFIQNAPVFKGCEGLSKEENKVCFDKKMKKFVQNNFDAGLANELGLHSGKHKIDTQFIIDQNGNVVDIKIKAPHPKLKKETAILIKKLPKFKPGIQNDKTVKVRYTLPISFRVE